MPFAAAAAAAAALVSACSSPAAPPEQKGERGDTVVVPRALTDFASGYYLQYQGGLYPEGANAPPADHAAEGRRRAAQMQPLDVNGNPSPNGKIVMLSLGMSNATQEFCAGSGYTQCDAFTFMGKAAADPQVEKQRLVIINGARGGQVAASWTSPTSDEYRRIRDDGLAPRGLSEQQVQVLWIKLANSTPRVSLPAANADAIALTTSTATVLRTIKLRYPNVRQVYLASRTYAGYATTALNPEPYAFETGLAMKWVVESQILQLRGQQPAPHINTGDLKYTVAPWVAWGPYFWAEGPDKPRGDGFFWVRQDFGSDGTHPATTGREKVGQLLLDFFKTSPYTRCWFVIAQTCS